DAIQQMGITVANRFAGANRLDTAAQFATYAVGSLGFSNSTVMLARGTDFADALAGAQYTGDPKPTLLTQDPTHVGKETGQYLDEFGTSITNLVAAGGPSSVSDATTQIARVIADRLRLTSLTPEIVSNDGQTHD